MRLSLGGGPSLNMAYPSRLHWVWRRVRSDRGRVYHRLLVLVLVVVLPVRSSSSCGSGHLVVPGCDWKAAVVVYRVKALDGGFANILYVEYEKAEIGQ
jgi:hypothetical protein